ncbi:MAG: 2-oxoacid:ferredoxin oxidoreductase subunit beta [Candidatus Nitricoxidivorans perseverans]|uniref:2-oxoacid:ferredoxin oxidoreductase subunit beta n=1 Tax=Candidatus Nitricoxidivorans perseverans TaxID=2975601 RepID=A0AA49FKC8_9PROT|nr:MAG: 2-oxoacid:ferredoxin oxidoreductase subunit beta [Candidatus Nitricoxidivorans perseverans]
MNACLHKVSLPSKDYKDNDNSFWCPGCGHHGILTGLLRALSEAGVDPDYLVNVSGIGCSSRLPYFVKSYKMHTLHGRAGPVATGVQLARPDLSVVVTGGDGDGFSIGGGHMPHLARKNVNMTYVLMDNHIYGLTKGQVSPTSRPEMKASTTPYGGVEPPLDPVLYMLTFGASYVAQAFAGNVKLVTRLIREGMEHKGFAFINVLSQCPTFNELDDAKHFKGICEEIAADHDVTDLDAAMHVVNAARAAGRTPTGLLYRVDRPTLDERMAQLVENVGGHKDYDLRKIIDLSRP